MGDTLKQISKLKTEWQEVSKRLEDQIEALENVMNNPDFLNNTTCNFIDIEFNRIIL